MKFHIRSGGGKMYGLPFANVELWSSAGPAWDFKRWARANQDTLRNIFKTRFPHTHEIVPWISHDWLRRAGDASVEDFDNWEFLEYDATLFSPGHVYLVQNRDLSSPNQFFLLWVRREGEMYWVGDDFGYPRFLEGATPAEWVTRYLCLNCGGIQALNYPKGA